MRKVPSWKEFWCHVDDFVYTGSKEWLHRTIGSLMELFKISSHFKGSFKYIGLNVVQTNSAVC